MDYAGAIVEIRVDHYCTKSADDQVIAVTVVADIMSLVLITPPGDWGADVVVCSTQRFGIPMF